MALTRLAHQLIREHFHNKKKSLALDLTLGNGHDFLFLLELGFEKVIGFDIQEAAIEIVHEKLKQQQPSLNHRASLIQTGHENLDIYIESQIDCAMFNLGYLPHGDKAITTLAETSMQAINSAMGNLSEHGLITLLCYPGHQQGRQELQMIQSDFANHKTNFRINTHQSSTPSASSPVLFSITHK